MIPSRRIQDNRQKTESIAISRLRPAPSCAASRCPTQRTDGIVRMETSFSKIVSTARPLEQAFRAEGANRESVHARARARRSINGRLHPAAPCDRGQVLTRRPARARRENASPRSARQDTLQGVARFGRFMCPLLLLSPSPFRVQRRTERSQTAPAPTWVGRFWRADPGRFMRASKECWRAARSRHALRAVGRDGGAPARDPGGI